MENRVSKIPIEGHVKKHGDEILNKHKGKIVVDSFGRIVSLDLPIENVRRTKGLGYSLEVPTSSLMDLAWMAYQQGHYSESVELCEETNRRGKLQPSHYETVHLACAGLARTNSLLTTDPRWQVKQSFISKIDLRYPIEAIWFHLNRELSSSIKIARVEEFCKQAATDFWMIPAAHPTAALLVASWLLDNTDRDDLAKRFICFSLGWKYVYRRIDDLLLLANLLERLRAPKLLWTRLANIYFDFIALDTINKSALFSSGITIINPRRLLAFCRAVDDKEGIFKRFCADNGFPEQDNVMCILYESMNFASNERDKTPQFSVKSNYKARQAESWLTEENFQMMHPWFCLLEQHEREFIRNGDSAFVTCMTSDYSMACSQWWRTVESVLRRSLINRLGFIIDANPSWRQTDLEYAQTLAPEQQQKWEKVFLHDLADPQRRSKMTLTQMLVLINQCMADLRGKKISRSLIRRNVVEYLGSQSTDFRWVKGEPDDFADMRSYFSPNVFTEQTIALFRNAASHDQPMKYEYAVVGRLLAIRILDFIHYPLYCVDTKVRELKQRLLAKPKVPS
jgi:hypothetical protein